MARAYADTVAAATRLAAQAAAAGAVGLPADACFLPALQEACYLGDDPGRTVRGVLDAAAARGVRAHVAAATAVLLDLFDPERVGLFREFKHVDDHRRAALLPPLPAVAAALRDAVEAALNAGRRQRVCSTIFETVVVVGTGGGTAPAALLALEMLLASPAVAAAAVAHPRWITGRCGKDFVDQTLLGGFFAYEASGGRGGSAIAAQYEYATRLASVLKAAFLLPDARRHPTLRDGLLGYVVKLLRINFELRKAMPKRGICSSSHVLRTLLMVLLVLVLDTRSPFDGLAYPIHDASRLELPKDEPLTAGGSRAAIDSYTTSNGAGEGADEAEGYADLKQALTTPPDSKGSDGEDGFDINCEVFYLCGVALELSVAAHAKHSKELRLEEIPRIEHAVAAMAQMMPGGRPPPQVAAALRAARAVVDDFATAYERPSAFTTSLLKYMEYSAFVYMRAATGAAAADFGTPVTALLPRDAPCATWRLLPEFLVTNTACLPEMLGGDVFASYLSQGGACTHFLTLVAALMAAPGYLVNPHSRAALAESFAAAVRGGGQPAVALCGESPAVAPRVVPAIMNAFVDLDLLGGINQFEKYAHRHTLGSALQQLCAASAVRDHLVQLSKATTEIAHVKFFNMMLDDVSFLLSDGIERVRKVHAYEAAQRDPSRWLAMTPDERRRIEQGYARANTQLRSRLVVAGQSLEVVAMLMHAVPEAFLQPALAEKAAGMLNFALVALAGEASGEVALNNPRKYGFNHGPLLENVLQCYVALGSAPSHELFDKHIAEDERCYSPERFEAVLETLIDRCDELGIREEVIGEIAEVFNRVGTHHVVVDWEAVSLPDDLQDPILACLIENPVQLPGSYEWCEHRMIYQHLLNDSTNPFNRETLTVHDLDKHNARPEVAAEAARRRARAQDFIAAYKARQEGA